ncbi:MAG: LytR/AlgR family response regulator transcription factor [Agathobacter sp.]
MIDVYVCEDIQEQREAIARYINSAIMIQEYDMKLLLATDSPEMVIERLKRTKNVGIYFLDIDLHTSKNGLMLAKEIREYDPRGFIVFITSHSEMSFLTFQYKVEALDFILKDEPQQLQQRICECLEHVKQKYSSITRGSGKTITITRGGRKLTLEYDDIMFFETSVNEHKLIAHTENKSIEFFGKLQDIEDEVGEEFIRCHRSYLINKKNVKEVNYTDKYIVMRNQARCPISHRMLRQVKKNI